ncbi:MAG TPA: class I adenylate-forming enzyme family protein [Acidimicrobiia bacterium]|nr:class I adenylate-forming enzyme family protein [Acidimicrobiia bacterium]
MRTRVENVNVAGDLARTASARPADVALWYEQGDHAWRYERLLAEAAAVMTWLCAHGVRPGDRVVLLMGSWPEHVAAWYAILAAGAVVVDVNYIVQDEEWRYVLQDSEPAAVIGGAPFRARLTPLATEAGEVPILWAEQRGAGWVGADAHDFEPVDRVGDDVAVIAYTSGTTGLPKGVMHTHGLIDRQLRLLADVQEYRAGDVLYQAIPLFALQGYLPLVASAVRAGGAVFLADRFDATELSRASRRFGFTYLTLSAPMLDAIMRLPEPEQPVFPALRLLTAGGAPLQPEIRARFEELVGVPVSQGFGMTEVLGVLVADYEGDAPWGSCGRIRPLESRDIVVLDDDGHVLGAGEVGEFAVHRDCVMAGYWGRPDLYAEQFTGDWFRTGDIGKIDDAGYFFVLDRKKDVIIRGGFNIYSAEIERVLSEHPAVAEATVVGAPDEHLGEVPVAFVVPSDSSADREVLADKLLGATRERLGSLKTPVWIRVVDADDLPRNALRKVQKRALRDSLRTPV